jgi:hypothetical protein
MWRPWRRWADALRRACKSRIGRTQTDTQKTLQQSTLEEIIESERKLLLTADQRYGSYSRHARECSIFLSQCIISVDPDRKIFVQYFSHLKKHLMLALLSTLRLHKVQAHMVLRQALEAGAAAAFAIANPEPEHFAKTDAQGFIDPSQELTRKRYQWLDKHFPAGSAVIKEKKRLINKSAHADILTTSQTFQVNEAGNEISTPFFDVEDEYHVKADLWLTASISIELMDLLYGVNKEHDVVKFILNFETDLQRIYEDNSALLTEMKSTERYKRFFERMQNLSE